jgi:hypothetical protein
MATKFTYTNEVGRKWDVGSGTPPTQKQFKKKKDYSANLQIQLCVKREDAPCLFNMFFYIFHKFELEHYMLNLFGEKVCTCGLAEVLNPQRA